MRWQLRRRRVEWDLRRWKKCAIVHASNGIKRAAQLQRKRKGPVRKGKYNQGNAEIETVSEQLIQEKINV